MRHRHALWLNPRMNLKAFIGIFLALSVGVAVASPDERGWQLDTRYRAERVDDATSHTLRLRLGYRWATDDSRWSSQLEGEHVEPIRLVPTVADPGATEVNQAWLRFSGDVAAVTVGRQRLLFDNQRFIGNVGWRQNEQTFDALHAAIDARDAHLRYAYLDRVHRVVGLERDHDSHLLNLGWTPKPGHAISTYAYLLDDRDVNADSSMTVGVRWTGGHAPFGWTLEVARQCDYADQAGSFALDYFLIAPTVDWLGIQWTVGWERLGGDGARGFSTPLATLHAFNGWADRFLTTPVAGLDDRHVVASGLGLGGQWVVAYRSYAAVQGDADLGHEWNASYGRRLTARWPLHGLVKVADYRGSGYAPDVRKVWLQLEWRPF